ncbi:enoyl-CoA hydratase/isomerase family protein [Saccharopolyspora sp. NPDC047091]|uniref:enoyl-CoA hydratase/isomerase family protein n=1 Tax=Saccharopolyspora sp. NPDC047091 TaxID=3155924 RepID=UPI0033E3352C
MKAVEQEYATLRVVQDGRVLTAFVEAPPHNYMTAAMQRDFIALVDAVEHDRSIGAVVVTGGVPGRYITHYDIGDLLAASEGSRTRSRRATAAVVRSVALLHRRGGATARRLLRRGPLAEVHRLVAFNLALERVLRSPAVWIAAVDGPCGGGGLEMSVFFDLRFCSESARFVLPELSIGLSTTFGGRRLAQLVGPSRALELMLSARPLDAAEAQRWGLVDEVVVSPVAGRGSVVDGVSSVGVSAVGSSPDRTPAGGARTGVAAPDANGTALNGTVVDGTALGGTAPSGTAPSAATPGGTTPPRPAAPGAVLARAQHRAAVFARRPRDVVAAQKQLFHDPDATTATESLLRELVAQGVGVPTERVRSALRRWLELQGPDGDSTFLTDPRPWQDGTAVDLVRDR